MHVHCARVCMRACVCVRVYTHPIRTRAEARRVHIGGMVTRGHQLACFHIPYFGGCIRRGSEQQLAQAPASGPILPPVGGALVTLRAYYSAKEPYYRSKRALLQKQKRPNA